MTPTRAEIMQMDAAALRLAIAEAKGWRMGTLSIKTPPTPGLECYIDADGNSRCQCDWPTSIAEAYELEGEVPDAEHHNYAMRLAEVLENDFIGTSWFELAHATPEQRSRAWLIWKTGAE